MRRRIRIDLGQAPTSSKEDAVMARKRARWAERNKDKPADENPFLVAIRPDQEHYGDPSEKGDELKARLNNQEFGNFPGYFNYRNKATSDSKIVDDKSSSSDAYTQNKTNHSEPGEEQQNRSTIQPLDAGLSDIRLTVFRSEWFHDREVLDIGCNRGHVTYAIARLFRPRSIIGIDIDLKIINMANQDLYMHLDEKTARDECERAVKCRLEGDRASHPTMSASQFPISCYLSQGPLSLEKELLDSKGTESIGVYFPNNLVFVEHNYVLARDDLVEKQKAQFDTIVCLSVTKWIHLNYRDDGMKRFFKRIYKHLRPDGFLILEAQPFDNYARRKKLSNRLKANYYSIKFKPEEFDDYLLGEQIGFRRIIYETITDHKCTGFKRPLKVFLK